MRLTSTLTILLCISSSCTFAEELGTDSSFFDFTTTELHYQYGSNFQRAFSSEPAQQASVYTVQHVNAWKYGDNFFFVDFIDARDTGSDVYSEFYSNFSLGKMLDREITAGPIKDIGLIAGLNYSKDAKVYKYLPGVRLSWDIPKFTFFNTDFTAYIDDSRGVAHGGAPAETNSYMVDVSWAIPFSIGRHDFGVEGHVEYIGKRRNEFGNRVNSHILAQPQIRYDIGKTLFDSAGILFVGVEYQLWINKLGGDKDDNVVQALVVMRF
ncbi:MAG: nucleoside-binding protein [Porticoccus sp.]|nr:nucleoside-binding protein [Porticoccus sp.]